MRDGDNSDDFILFSLLLDNPISTLSILAVFIIIVILFIVLGWKAIFVILGVLVALFLFNYKNKSVNNSINKAINSTNTTINKTINSINKSINSANVKINKTLNQ